MAIRAAWSLATLLGLASPALAEDCRLALVLALDVSGSVSANEDLLQRVGLAQALLAPEVGRAFLTGDPVALYAFEWSDQGSQAALLPGWQMIQNREDLLEVAGALARSRSALGDDTKGATAVGAALIHAAQVFAAAPACGAYTVDVSGDGGNNEGIEPRRVLEHYSFEGVTVNALVVGGALDDRGQRLGDGYLTAWFKDHVLHGPDAFWILADSYEDYERAMRIKLMRELGAPMLSGWPDHDRREPLG